MTGFVKLRHTRTICSSLALVWAVAACSQNDYQGKLTTHGVTVQGDVNLVPVEGTGGAGSQTHHSERAGPAPTGSVVAPITVEGQSSTKRMYGSAIGAAMAGAVVGLVATGDVSSFVTGAAVGGVAGAGSVSTLHFGGPERASIDMLRRQAQSPAQFHQLLQQEIDKEVALLENLGELRPVYDPDGYRYVILLLYRQDAKERGEAIVEAIVRSSMIETNGQVRDRRRGFVLFEAPYQKTVADCIKLAKSDQDPVADERNLVRARELLARMAGNAESLETQLAIRRTCYNFGEAQRLMLAAGLPGAGPYLLTFDGSYTDQDNAKLAPSIAQATACPRYISNVGRYEAMSVQFRRDPELDAAVVETLLETLKEKDCQSRWLTSVRLELLDAMVRGSRVSRELAQGMFGMVSLARVAAND